jgi:hypothetical protein
MEKPMHSSIETNIFYKFLEISILIALSACTLLLFREIGPASEKSTADSILVIGPHQRRCRAAEHPSGRLFSSDHCLRVLETRHSRLPR